MISGNFLHARQKHMRVLISGSSGMVGSAVSRLLSENGYTVSRLLRQHSKATILDQNVDGDVRWDPVADDFDAQAAESADAVVHLAGASIGGGRWTKSRKALLRSSRVEATRHLVNSLAALSAKPKVFVGVSAIGYYGDRRDEKLTDHSGPGSDFLAQICKDWERESNRAADFGARVVILRFGIILSTRGGALPRMLMPIKMFVGGKLGSGQQWMSWISLDDVAGIIRYALENEAIRGPINTVSPNAIRNVDFIKKAARAVHRQAIFPAPAFALRLALGEVADGLLLSSQRVLPEKLRALGYEFQDIDLGFTLARLISEKK
jgi:uncharacterized protein (TIGR01777 family)